MTVTQYRPAYTKRGGGDSRGRRSLDLGGRRRGPLQGWAVRGDAAGRRHVRQAARVERQAVLRYQGVRRGVLPRVVEQPPQQRAQLRLVLVLQLMLAAHELQLIALPVEARPGDGGKPVELALAQPQLSAFDGELDRLVPGHLQPRSLQIILCAKHEGVLLCNGRDVRLGHPRLGLEGRR
eukprot:scaffold31785_cov72-Phaeocystis_antarctica.AAC.10